MVHVDPLPGTPRNTLAMDQIVENSLKEVRLYLEAGVVSITPLILSLKLPKIII
jgi:predicted TIM-barrel enzyme